MHQHIYCPECRWKPVPEARWVCDCDYVWHTFATRGLCPDCRKQWEETRCPACLQWSLHIDWYHDHAADTDELELFQTFIESLELEKERPRPKSRQKDNLIRDS